MRLLRRQILLDCLDLVGWQRGCDIRTLRSMLREGGSNEPGLSGPLCPAFAKDLSKNRMSVDQDNGRALTKRVVKKIDWKRLMGRRALGLAVIVLGAVVLFSPFSHLMCWLRVVMHRVT